MLGSFADFRAAVIRRSLYSLSLSLSLCHAFLFTLLFFQSTMKTSLPCAAYGFVIASLSFPPAHHEQFLGELKVLSLFNGCHFLIHHKQQSLLK